MRRGCEEQVVAIGGQSRNLLGSNAVVGAGAVLNEHPLAPHLGQSCGKDARHIVIGAARRIG